MSEWVRALGIDYGTVRIGLAVSDDLGFLAHPLETVAGENPDKAVIEIARIVRERKIGDIVIGLPLHTNGDEGKAVKKVRGFAELLRAELEPAIRWHEIDERYTTMMAMEKLHSAGRNEKNSRKIIDQASAVEILQKWLDDRAPTGNFFPADEPDL
ncbi:MAG: Holliday junction resolvase RuvX [Verrucomicrobiales bacterium]|nr:Holliday junction resolvase RuvX [Verrucomicrobiales bacterium]